MTRPVNNVSIQFCASGDHRTHIMPPGKHREVTGTWDRDSNVLEVQLDERTAEDMYWWLTEIIPQLRKDRR